MNSSIQLQSLSLSLSLSLRYSYRETISVRGIRLFSRLTKPAILAAEISYFVTSNLDPASIELQNLLTRKTYLRISLGPLALSSLIEQ
jgi:hypothetical protein